MVRGSSTSIPNPAQKSTIDDVRKGVPNRFHARQPSETDKRYADLRVKMGEKKSPQRYEPDSVPSEISLEDAWGELPRYQDMVHKQQIAKEKEDLQKKKDSVRKTLEL